jgi:hypothetical protein
MKAIMLVCLPVLLPMALLAQPEADTMWVRTYHDMYDMSFANIQPSFDNGMVIMVNRTVTWDTAIVYHDVPLVGTNADGEILFQSLMEGGPDNTYIPIDQCRSVDADSCYLFLAQRTWEWFGEHTSMYVVKADRNGTFWWSQEYGDSASESAAAIVATTDGNFVIASAIPSVEHSSWYRHVCLRKISSNGTDLWMRTYESPCSIFPQRAIATSDGGCLVSATQYISPDQAYENEVIKTDTDGNEEWRCNFFDALFEQTCGMVETEDGYAVGLTWPVNGLHQISLAKLDMQGQVQWRHSYSHDDARNEIVSDIIRSGDGGFLMAGYAKYPDRFDYPMLLIKADADGEFQWRALRGTGTHNLVYGVCQQAGGWMVAGANESLNGEWSWPLLAKFGPVSEFSAGSSLAAKPLPGELHLGQNYPNPFNPSTAIIFDLPRTMPVSLSVYDVLGQRVTTLTNGPQSGGRHTVSFNGGDLPSGSYYCTLTADGLTQTRRMLLVK